MPTFSLKRYQQQALVALDDFCRAARVQGPAAAFLAQTGLPYQAQPFGDVPCVCLRIPTGGGKTLLAAHAIGDLSVEWPAATPKPLTLWLVPSDAIRSQTLAALSVPGHPLREALAQGVGDDVRVCGLEEVATLSPQDFDAHAVVIVATIQSFRIEDTSQRNVYAFSEAFEPHFRSVPETALQALHALPDALVTAADAEADEAGRTLLQRFVGSPKRSLANWLALRRPYVIVDEAHNAKTERSFEALKRLAPSFVLDLTATPLRERSNVLFHVSAQQLQGEHMIKLPIVLAEHTRGWQAAVYDAVQTQRLLEAEAKLEEAETGDHIRPIVLLQAQNSNEPVNVDVLRQHLIDELNIDPAEVKVATGAQREIDGLDLASRDCPVRYIITVQALREGWDCPFAYVLCSVQNVRSATAIEQLLGRILRMPYARQRRRPALNKAYAHVSESETGSAANALADRLVDGMGFEALDVASMIAPQLPLGLQGGEGASSASAIALPALTVDLPAGRELPPAVSDAVLTGTASITSDGARVRVQVRGTVDDALAHALVTAQRGKQRERVGEQIERHNALVTATLAPCNRGERFAPVPRLGYFTAQGQLQLLEREAVLEEVELDLLAQPISLPGFTLAEQEGAIWQVYLDGARVQVGHGETAQLALDEVRTSVTDQQLAAWLARELQHPSRNVARDMLPAHLRAFTLAALHHLLHSQRVPLEQLVRHKYPLLQRLSIYIAQLRDEAGKRRFAQLVLDGCWQVDARGSYTFEFDPQVYPVPASKRYRGRFAFPKHFYPVLSDLEDGSEEWQCAVAIDHHPAVRRWVRNLDSDPRAGFWLPTSWGRFYPDFVCELTDGRLLVAEYKGEQIRHMPRELEKAQVGRLWADASGGSCLFAMLYRLEHGMDLRQQIDRALKRA